MRARGILAAMVLSQTSEYAVRLMYQLARGGAGERLRATDLAERADVPAPYVSKVLARLVKAGLVDGQKGHHGGFLLARPAGEITLTDVLDAVSDWDDLDRRCFFGWDRCRPDQPCPLHPIFAGLKESAVTWADSWTLADLASRAPVPRHE